MNPGKLNKRLSFYSKSLVDGQEQFNTLFTLWAAETVKTKRRLNEQNEESYEFLIRKKNEIEPYLIFQCDNVWYDVLTVENYQKEKGYLLLKCEKAKIHNFYDTVTVSRIGWVENEFGVDVETRITPYENIPCELIKIDNSNVVQSQQQLVMNVSFVLEIETKYILKPGDELEIHHRQDSYQAFVEDYFRYHTHQDITIKMKGDA